MNLSVLPRRQSRASVLVERKGLGGVLLRSERAKALKRRTRLSDCGRQTLPGQVILEERMLKVFEQPYSTVGAQVAQRALCQGRISGSSVGKTELSILRSGLKL